MLAKGAFLALPLALLSVPAVAQGEDVSCRNGMFGEENDRFALARVVPAGRTYFFEDMDGCPDLTARCRTKTYVLGGQRLVTGRTHGAFVCAYFPNNVGGSAGWIESARLRTLPVREHRAAKDWVGEWADGDNPTVTFSMKKGRLHAKGIALWFGYPPGSRKPNNVHTGEVDEPVVFEANRASAPECGIVFHHLGDILVAADPTRDCDGLNVAFTGVYQRIQRTSR
jgi:hypothetical protein